MENIKYSSENHTDFTVVVLTGNGQLEEYASVFKYKSLCIVTKYVL